MRDNKERSKEDINKKRVSHRFLIPFIFVLVAGMVSVPLWIFGMEYTTDYLHFAQSKLSKDLADHGVNEGFTPSPATFGIVKEPEVKKYSQIGTLQCDRIGLECSLFYGANRVCMRYGAAVFESESLPGYGETTTVTAYVSKGFRKLFSAEIDDMVTISTSWGLFNYKVTEKVVMDKEDWDTEDNGGIERLVLFCDDPNEPLPSYSNKRLYVVCEKVSGPAVEVKGNE